MRRLVVLLVLVALTQPAMAQRNLKDIPPPDPELERKALQLAEGFEINLFAADPQIAKPIQMNFDPQGRLWLVSSEVYPHIAPGQQANDRVLILEDADGDGTADKTTVFADGLLIPTGIEPGDGGAYVANSTELLHFADSDGDGHADQRRTVLSGFGTEDTHHILHTLRWGPGGALYFNQSIYIHSHIETPYGVRRLNGGGIWKFRPETFELDIFARGWINAWGHQRGPYGQSFVTDGAGGEGINFAIPGGAYRTAVGVERILPGLNPGSPKYCGLEFVGGRHLPDEWQDNLLTNDFRGHRVCRFRLKEDGSGFAAQQLEDLIKTTHVAFRPIDIKMGPDGAIYIADWYNPIIQHGEVDFRDPRRDHTHGRIWRVTYRGRDLVERPKLVGASTAELLDSLKAPEQWTRQQAKRVLKEQADAATDQADAVEQQLAGWVADLDPADPLIDRHRLEALWVRQSLRRPDTDHLQIVLKAEDPRVRAAGTRVLGDWHEQIGEASGLLAELVEDPSPRVRLEAVTALRQIPQADSVIMALKVLDQPMDQFLDYALWLTCRELRDHWLPLVQSGRLTFGGNAEHLTFALRAVGNPAALQPLMNLLVEGRIPPAQQNDAVKLIAQLGGPQELKRLFEIACADSTPPPRQALIVSQLAEATKTRKVRPSGELAKLEKLLRSDDAAVLNAASRAAGVWKIDPLLKDVKEIALAEAQPHSSREAAIAGLEAFGTDASLAAIEDLTGGDHPAEIRGTAVLALINHRPQRAAQAAVSLLRALKSDEAVGDLFRGFLSHRKGAEQLAVALKGQTLPPDTAKLGLRAVSAAGRPEAALEQALRKAGSLGGQPQPLTAEEVAAIVSEVSAHGDPAAGEAVFRQTSLACLKCHAIGGAGGRVGPDLVSLGGSAQVDYLIESLLEPNKKVKENYQTLVVLTDEGKVHSGVKVRQSETALILRDVNDREIAIPLDAIEEQTNGASIMPAGLTEKLTRRELVDLVRFLSALGKDGDFSIGTTPLLRRWRVMLATPEAATRLRRTSYDMAATDDSTWQWQEAYSRVDGSLPLSDIAEIRVRNRVAAGSRGVGFVRGELEVGTAGPIALTVNSTVGLSLWLNEEPVEVAERMEVVVPSGIQRLTFAIDLSQRTDSLRVGLAEVAGSPAQVRFVTGK